MFLFNADIPHDDDDSVDQNLELDLPEDEDDDNDMQEDHQTAIDQLCGREPSIGCSLDDEDSPMDLLVNNEPSQ